LAPAGYSHFAGIDHSKDRLMKKPKPKARTVAIRARMKPSVKAMAEQLAQKDARSMGDWLERLIAAEAARRKSRKANGRYLLGPNRST
jgi:hypothetical protein